MSFQKGDQQTECDGSCGFARGDVEALRERQHSVDHKGQKPQGGPGPLRTSEQPKLAPQAESGHGDGADRTQDYSADDADGEDRQPQGRGGLLTP
jgi:hypothetical protein